MSEVAKIDMSITAQSIARINDSMSKINDAAQKLLTQYQNASDATNLNAFVSIAEAFEKVAVQTNQTTKLVAEVALATDKYIKDVAEIDEVDSSLFN